MTSIHLLFDSSVKYHSCMIRIKRSKLISILPVAMYVQQTVLTFAIKKRTFWPNGSSCVNVTKKTE